jgi:predicted  nucleic acid-binding Zn-ribbon protein
MKKMSQKPIELIDQGIRSIAYEETEDRVEHLTKMIIQAFTKIEARLDAIERRLDAIEHRLDVLERDMAKVKKHLKIA